MNEKIYRVQMNSKGMPNFSTAVEVADRPQDDEFKNFDRGDLIALIEAQEERIGELLADRPQGEWKEVYAETDYRNGWIEFSCECCGHQHGLESGEYGWSYGEPIPWKFCPLCGARMKGGEDDADE
jgi:hypothetical protein